MWISVAVITKNVEEMVGETMESVKEVVDEIVVVDSGSTDKTLEVVRRFTKKVYTHPFERDFSKLRNFALEKASGDWILVLDADERLSDGAKQAIPKLLKDSAIDGYWFRRKTYITPKKYLQHGLFYPDYQLRLFRNKRDYRYTGAVHEQLTIPKEKTREVAYDILHFPQHPKYDSFTSFANLLPYVTIQAKELASLDKPWYWLYFQGIGLFLSLFFGGFVLGKGFLDGWLGFRAHLMFAASIALAYFLAGGRKLKSRYALHLFYPRSYEAHRLAVDLVKLQSRVLDLGCATGYIASELREKDCQVVCVEKDRQAAKVARRFCQKVIVADLEEPRQISLPAKHFDYVLLLDVLEHLKNRDQLLIYIHKWLTPSGTLIISTPNVAHISVRLKLLQGKFIYQEFGILDKSHVHLFTKETLLSLLEETGFKVDQILATADFGQLPYLGKIACRLPKPWQFQVTQILPELLGVQFVAVCRSGKTGTV